MANIIEIERKFLVDHARWEPQGERLPVRQGFLATTDKLVCRVRQKGERFYLSVKADLDGITRHDFEYEIPALDGGIMLDQHCERAPVEKVRHILTYEGMTWEVDVFSGLNQGLIVAEIELNSVDQPFAKPPWVTEEVSDDLRYLNTNLYKHPYSEWGEANA
ncbi:MAG TPA: adenylate cyclase [Gammaproteobacteria bacterium]|jgi:adenylate cyclase|nr:adenylate cyclase [Gammaproteobacteria bacterium]